MSRALARSRSLVLLAEPGAGKTSRVPLHLWQSGFARGEVLVLEPRRLAARLAARHVAALAGEEVGGSVGYQVRHEDVTSARTRVRFVTEALLVRRLLDDPLLSRTAAVVFDEFHERHVAGDLGLALVRRLQATRRPDLAIVVMSATLDPAPLARVLPDAEVVVVPGRAHPVEIRHLERPDDRPLAEQVAGAARRLLAEDPGGDVLVFLPGATEIRRAAEACASLARAADLLVVSLHGDLPPAAQDRAVRPADRRKIILSTNVAETSVTIEGVTAVVDSGLARVAGHDPWSGLPSLRVRPVSRAAATQRAGRAGRTGPGRALRLFTRHDFDSRPAAEVPEVLRAELGELCLTLLALGVDAGELYWIDAPPPAALDTARGLLGRLGAVDGDGGLTPLGREMARLPLHPRQARLIAEAARRGARELGCVVAAILGERDLRVDRGPTRESGPSDLTALAERFAAARAARFTASALAGLGLNPGAVHAVERGRRQLAGLTGHWGRATLDDAETALARAVLAAYPDRVAERAAARGGAGADEILLSSGGRARLSHASVVREARWMVAVEAELSVGGAAQRLPLVHLASRIELDWLLDLDAPELRESVEATWNDRLERVEEVARVTYGALVLDERRRAGDAGERTTTLLRERALARGVRAFADPEALEALFVRVAFARSLGGPDAPPPLDEAAATTTLADLCEGRRSFAELLEADLVGSLLGRLTPAARRAVDRAAPAHVELAGGRRLAVRYEAGKPPWVESYLQDFFGTAEGPRLGGERVPVTLHLLAPNRRPVQVTTDLAGFWERHYPGLRPALARRYPKHAWPEDPRHARPPAPKGRR